MGGESDAPNPVKDLSAESPSPPQVLQVHMVFLDASSSSGHPAKIGTSVNRKSSIAMTPVRNKNLEEKSLP